MRVCVRERSTGGGSEGGVGGGVPGEGVRCV